jgi:hypothetical protein
VKTLTRQQQELQRQLEDARRQIGALTGVVPPAAAPSRRLPQGVTEEHVQQALQELDLVIPGIGKLVENGRLDRLLSFLDEGLPQVQEQGQHYWRTRGAETIRTLQTEVKTQIGEISQRGMQRLMASFHAELSANEEFFERWQAGDPNLVSEFISEYKQDVLDPYHTSRASGTASSVARARTLPRGGNTSSVVPGQSGEPALDPKDEDAVHKRAFQRMRARVAANSPAA